MVITALGRVELDITKVPTSTLGKGRDPDSFEGRLSDVRGPHATEGESRRVDARNPEPPQPDDIDSGRDTAVREDRRRDGIHPESTRSVVADSTEADGSATDDGTGALHQSARREDPAASQGMSSGQEAHQAHPARGPENKAPLSAPQAQGVTQGEAQPQGAEGLASSATGHGSVQAEPATTSPSSQEPHAHLPLQGDARSVAEAAGRAARTSTRSGWVGYRTVSAATLAAAEAARDSVIKQIVFELGPDGGRMRMHLSPPELGHLDIRMVVEKGAVLQLSIAAERPEVLMMLDKHIPQLRHALTQQGLDLSGADVQTSLFGHREHGDGASARHGDDLTMSPQQPEVAATPRHVGYVTAEGLDFWV